MSYRVVAPYVVLAHGHGVWEGYEGAIVPDGLNDERCKQLAEEGFLAKDDDKSSTRSSK